MNQGFGELNLKHPDRKDDRREEGTRHRPRPLAEASALSEFSVFKLTEGRS